MQGVRAVLLDARQGPLDTEHYTDEDRLFYPQKAFSGFPTQWTSWFYMYVASARATG